jgi:pimeloyl-CoA dehydrogenase small subunit
MDFDLSDEQRQLKDSVERLLAGKYADLKQREAAQAEPAGYAKATWAQFAELGLTAIPFAEEHGGLGAGPIETMLVMEAIGKSLAIEPYLATVVLGGGVLRHGGSASQQAAIVPKIIDGSMTLALAHQERQSRFDLHDVATTAKADGKGGYTIDGEKLVVLNGDSADQIVVVARTSGGRRDAQGIGLFLVDGNAKGVARRGSPTQDGGRSADMTFKSVHVSADAVIGEAGKGLPILERVIDEAMAALAAEGVGAMAALNDMTVDYLKTRKQFGVAIGSFQVLQHRAVDMFTHLEQARSMAYFATMMVGETNAVERRKAMAACKVQIGKAARFIGQEAIQLHGGIGMTMEYKAGHYFKRLALIDLAFGDHEYHLRRLAAAGGLISPAAAG